MSDFMSLLLQVRVELDYMEVTDSVWTSPADAIKMHKDKNVWLAPPQIYELSRMRNFSQFDKLRAFVHERESKGCVSWLPLLVKCRNGTLALYPGDDLYPEKPDYHGDREEPLSFSDIDMSDASLSTPNKNRMEQYGPNSCVINCNIVDPFGHLLPVAF